MLLLCVDRRLAAGSDAQHCDGVAKLHANPFAGCRVLQREVVLLMWQVVVALPLSLDGIL